MNVGTPHLDLEELLAEINGDALGDRAWAHLITCDYCRTEAERWAAVAGGVRHLVAVTPAPSPLPVVALAGAGTTRPGGLRREWARRERLRSVIGRPRYVLVAAAAAAAVVAGGTAYGLTAGLTAGTGGPAPAAAGLTAVNGCSELVGTSGTLEQVNGTSLVVKTPGGPVVTVTTTPSTKLVREATGSLSAITDGAQVIVHGTGSNGTITAQNVSVGVTINVPKPPEGLPRRPGGLPKLPNLPGRSAPPKPNISHLRTPGIAMGTVADASAGRFTLIQPRGTRLTVITSSATVFTMVSASLSQLQTGQYVVAVGTQGPGGTLAATTVEQGSFLPNYEHGNGISSLPPLGCSSPAVATAALLSAH
jgi:hypothetical protein